MADDLIEASLFDQARGYWIDCEKIYVSKNGTVRRVAVREYIKPDIAATIFWLKNRRRQSWSNANNPDDGAKDEEVISVARKLRKALDDIDGATPKAAEPPAEDKV